MPYHREKKKRINFNIGGQRDVLKFNYVWKISEFASLTEDKGGFVKSPIFSAKEIESMKWRLTLYPKGERMSEEDQVAVYLRLLSFTDEHCYATCEFFIMQDKLKLISKSFEDIHPFLCGGKGWGFKNFVSRETILNSKEKFIPNDTLTVACKVTVLIKSEAQKVSMTTFGTGTSNDVKFVVSGEIFEAHQSILAARSSIFAKMFKTAKKEGDQTVIGIDDVNPKSFGDLLRSIYTANASNMTDTGYMFKTEIAKRFNVQ